MSVSCCASGSCSSEDNDEENTTSFDTGAAAVKAALLGGVLAGATGSSETASTGGFDVLTPLFTFGCTADISAAPPVVLRMQMASATTWLFAAFVSLTTSFPWVIVTVPSSFQSAPLVARPA